MKQALVANGSTVVYHGNLNYSSCCAARIEGKLRTVFNTLCSVAVERLPGGAVV